jgi:hypothetical protein
MNEVDHNGKRGFAPDGHVVIPVGSQMLDIGFDMRSMPEDDDERDCEKCGDALPLDGECDCREETEP